MVEIIQTL